MIILRELTTIIQKTYWTQKLINLEMLWDSIKWATVKMTYLIIEIMWAWELLTWNWKIKHMYGDDIKRLIGIDANLISRITCNLNKWMSHFTRDFEKLCIWPLIKFWCLYVIKYLLREIYICLFRVISR